jgi:hypothetical protein
LIGELLRFTPGPYGTCEPLQQSNKTHWEENPLRN